MLWALFLTLYAVCLIFLSRVHISSVTLEHLNGAYKVEEGNGQNRDPYLKEHGVVTYLVINPKVSCQSVECSFTVQVQTELNHDSCPKENQSTNCNQAKTFQQVSFMLREVSEK